MLPPLMLPPRNTGHAHIAHGRLLSVLAALLPRARTRPGPRAANVGGNDEQLRIGDTLLAINGRPASSISAAELAQGMAGPNGSRVMVLVSVCGSAGGGVREVTLLRERPAGVECEVADTAGGVSGDAHRKLEFDDELIPLPVPGANPFPGLHMLLILLIRYQDLILAFRVCVCLPCLFVMAQCSRLHVVAHVSPVLCGGWPAALLCNVARRVIFSLPPC